MFLVQAPSTQVKVRPTHQAPLATVTVDLPAATHTSPRWQPLNCSRGSVAPSHVHSRATLRRAAVVPFTIRYTSQTSNCCNLLFEYQVPKSDSVGYTPPHQPPSTVPPPIPPNTNPPTLNYPPVGERSPLAVPLAVLRFGVQPQNHFRPAAPLTPPIHSGNSAAPNFGEVEVEHSRKHTRDQQGREGIPARRFPFATLLGEHLLCGSCWSFVCPLPCSACTAVLYMCQKGMNRLRCVKLLRREFFGHTRRSSRWCVNTCYVYTCHGDFETGPGNKAPAKLEKTRIRSS